MKTYKSAIGLRGDCLYCPLPLSIDSYFNCFTNCYHCGFRRLNRTWGKDLRPADPFSIKRKLEYSVKNKRPKAGKTRALKNKITFRIGSRSDPYQRAEKKYKITREIIKILIELDWTFVIQTRFLHHLIRDEDLFFSSKHLVTFLPVISSGLEKDWEMFERKRTTPIGERFSIIRKFIKSGYNLGVNGEPFIPGFHTVKDFGGTLSRLQETGVKSYNVYNLHFNDLVAKNLHSIGVDIEKIWYYNQDKQWRKILLQLLDLSKKFGIRLGCPDFVNTGWGWKESANTCCGINAANPSTYNTHHWKQKIQKGEEKTKILKETFQGFGDKRQARNIMFGKECDFYTMKDVQTSNSKGRIIGS